MPQRASSWCGAGKRGRSQEAPGKSRTTSSGKHIKQLLYQDHARENPAEAYWLIATYPPQDRYREEALRREIDGREGVSSTAGAAWNGQCRYAPARQWGCGPR